MISYLISKNADVEAIVLDEWFEDICGCTPLMVACHYGNLGAARILLEEGHANVNGLSHDGLTALRMATVRPEGHHIVPTLLQHGANVNPPLDAGDHSPLMHACSLPGSAELVQQFFYYGAHVETKSDAGEQAVHNAARFSDEATMRLLLAHGANVNALSDGGATPLWLAAVEGSAPVLRILLEHGAQADWIYGYHGVILHHVTHRVESCEILLNHCRRTMPEGVLGNLLLHKDDFGEIPLHKITTIEIAKLLVEQPRREGNHLLPVCHAQLVSKDDKKSTPLGTRMNDAGCSDEHVDVMAYLQTFQSLTLSIPAPEEIYVSSTPTKRRKLTDRIAVKLNPALNDFQRAVGEEAVQVVMGATGLPDRIVYAILGCLCPLDMMKR